MVRTLLIDDEAAARDELRWLLAAHPGYTVVGEAATLATARRRLQQADYDLVFLDVQLFGGNGFDLVPDVAPGARVIFVTAFDRFALRAFEVNALDYLQKPVSTERFAAALAKRTGGSTPAQPPAFRADDTVLVRTDAGDRFVPLARISAIFSNENYSDVILGTGERFLTRRTLKAWEELLPPAQFQRAHRQALVNLAAIEGHRRDTRETAALRVTGVKEHVPVSRNQLAGLRPHLGPAEPAA
ncbi:MAG: LytTR family DNA-binding domain-containing protein [Lacunisphaera sp.]|nr:LytTR family DNA-binding domain-containing protein [Lacunisphaera sp.]